MATTTHIKRSFSACEDSSDLFLLSAHNQPQFTFAVPSTFNPYTAEDCNTLSRAETILELPAGHIYQLAPQHYRTYIINQAANILNSSPEALIQGLHSHPQELPELTDGPQTYYPPPKRTRHIIGYSTSAPSPPAPTAAPPVSMPFQFLAGSSRHDPEKFPGSSEGMAGNTYGHSQTPFLPIPMPGNGSFLSSASSGVAACMTGFNICGTSPSPGSSPSDYEPILGSSSGNLVTVSPKARPYILSGELPAVDHIVDAAQANEQQFSQTYTPQQAMTWMADDSTQYMPNYPALQATVVATPTVPAASQCAGPVQAQPSTRPEDMCYVDEQVSGPWPKQEPGDSSALTPLGASVPPMLGPGGAFGALPQAAFSQDPAQVGAPPSSLGYHHGELQPLVTSYVPATHARAGPVSDFLPTPETPVTAVGFHRGTTPPRGHDYICHRVSIPEPTQQYTDIQASVITGRKIACARRGPFKDQVHRQKTAETRKIGSCVRCKMQRIRCVEIAGRDTCEGCTKPFSRLWRLPCMRLKIVNIVLAKTTQVKGHEWTTRWKDNTILADVGNWESTETRILRVSEGYTDSFVELRVRRFVPQPGDSLSRSWVTPAGEKRSVQLPPYAVVDPDSIAKSYLDYIKRGVGACCRSFLSGYTDSLIRSTYWKALHIRESPGSLSLNDLEMLDSLLELWMTVRLTTRSFEIVGDETLDIPRDILDETHPTPGKIPIPPVMGAQLDSVLIHQIHHSTRKAALKLLNTVVTENKTTSWLAVYLSTFILLHNASLLIKHDASYARKHGMTRRFARVEKVQEYYTGAITMLTYFHYLNKAVFPFKQGTRDQEVLSIAALDGPGMDFVHATRKSVSDYKDSWQVLLDNDAYEDDFYFIAQMYEENWQPRQMKI